jgi:hypothetical protein
MDNYLKEYCLKNIWCNPEVDKQYFIRLVKMTKFGGDIAKTALGLHVIPLPDIEHFYHVYQLGGNTPTQFNFTPPEKNKWYRLDKYINHTRTFIQLYTAKGLLPARFLTYIRITTNGTILVAIRPQPKIIDLDRETIGIRFYSNAWFMQNTSHGLMEYLKVEGDIAENNKSFVELQSKFYNYRGMPGHAYLVHNGEYVTDAPPNCVKAGDILELVFDASVDVIYDFKMDKAYSFLSKLDTVRKYLIHPDKSYGKRINYWDDITFILGKKDKDGIFRGRQITNWDGKRIRMVSHNDYSIMVNVIVSLLDGRKDWKGKPVEKYTLRLLFRKSGKARPLVDVHERLLELYKFDDATIIKIMTGQIAGPDEWLVDNLEIGNYTKTMRSLNRTIDKNLVMDTLGYNAMAKITADNPIVPTIGSRGNYFNLHYQTSKSSTIYEYDRKGVLLNVVEHGLSKTYYPSSEAVMLIEPINSIKNHDPECYYCVSGFILNKLSGYRFYIKSKTTDEPWMDVTDKPGYYLIEAEKFNWSVNLDLFETLVLGDYYHVYHQFEMEPNDDVYEFDITVEKLNKPLPVPMGRVEVWLNGRALVQHVDFNVIWPHVVITNVEYLKDKGPQKITYRAIGFCNEDLSMQDTSQFGFVRHGYISLNNRYDVRENKVTQIIVGGKVVDRSQVYSDEEGGRLTSNDKGELIPFPSSYVKDGQPYQITDVDVPLRELIPYKTDILKARSKNLDSRISDFMTRWKPEIKLPNPITVEAWYRTYSPFMAKVLADIKNGIIKLPDRELTLMETHALVEPYLYLLDYEVCNQEFDIHYVVVYSHGKKHTKSVNPRTYAFLNDLNKRYLKESIKLNRCLTIAKR